jgi:hypothetical protein
MSDPPFIFIMPGASLMEISIDEARKEAVVRCPGCKVEERYRQTAEHRDVYFVHEDGCPVHEKIKKAQREYERRFVRRG